MGRRLLKRINEIKEEFETSRQFAEAIGINQIHVQSLLRRLSTEKSQVQYGSLNMFAENLGRLPLLVYKPDGQLEDLGVPCIAIGEPVEKYPGKVVLKYRTKLGFSQKKLAEETHMSYVSITRCETGYRFPQIKIIESLFDYFGLTIDYLPDIHPEKISIGTNLKILRIYGTTPELADKLVDPSVLEELIEYSMEMSWLGRNLKRKSEQSGHSVESTSGYTSDPSLSNLALEDAFGIMKRYDAQRTLVHTDALNELMRYSLELGGLGQLLRTECKLSEPINLPNPT